MKRCPACDRTFDDTLTFCLIDGSILDAPFDPASGSEADPQVSEEPEREVVTVVRAGGVRGVNAPASRGKGRIFAGLVLAMLVGVVWVTAYTWGLLSWEFVLFLSPETVLGIMGYGWVISRGAIMGLGHALFVIALLWVIRRVLTSRSRTLASSMLATAVLSVPTVPFLFWWSPYPNLDGPMFIKAVFVLLYSFLQGIVLASIFRWLQKP